ncbi:hypothetical protein PF001_g10879 [Phytophthora fragariae]|uniref:Macro domain-containing protein n=1 Tax=Phytophthora fragariae TaxID=53985 RepID=A0A6A4DMU6_9STRA|nr:hypothetical protein PF001_g10879 [Phytophthora fragariae]
MWSGRRRSAKTGRLSSAADPPKLRLAGTLLLRKDLLHDFLLYLDAEGLLALCEAMGHLSEAQDANDQISRTYPILRDNEWWLHLLQAHCHVDFRMFRMHRSVSVPTIGCDALADYLSLRGQLECFARCVQVVKGDLGTITSVEDDQVDCLVFPSSSLFQKPQRGVAGRVHERAGPDLNRIVANLDLRRAARTGTVLCTEGCRSRMKLLVHCVGPMNRQRDANLLLFETYVNALLAAERSHVTCAAVASISTGLHNFPVPQAAHIALSALRDLIRLRPHWNLKVAFVCIDDNVYENFQRARQETSQAFHSTAFAFPCLVRKLSMAEPASES